MTSAGDDALNVFSRDAATGLLTFLEAHVGTLLVEGVPVDWSYELVRDVAVSPGGSHVYTVSPGHASGSWESSITIHSRDELGHLTPEQFILDGFLTDIRMRNASRIEVSPDGESVLVLGDLEISSWNRNSGTGELAFADGHCIQGAPPCAVSPRCGLGVSPDSSDVYASCLDGVFGYARASSGTLVPLGQLVADGGDDAFFYGNDRLLDAPGNISGSPDFRLINRNPPSGTLEVLNTFGSGGGVRIAVSPDQLNVYVATSFSVLTYELSTSPVPSGQVGWLIPVLLAAVLAAGQRLSARAASSAGSR